MVCSNSATEAASMYWICIDHQTTKILTILRPPRSLILYSLHVSDHQGQHDHTSHIHTETTEVNMTIYTSHMCTKTTEEVNMTISVIQLHAHLMTTEVNMTTEAIMHTHWDHRGQHDYWSHRAHILRPPRSRCLYNGIVIPIRPPRSIWLPKSWTRAL